MDVNGAEGGWDHESAIAGTDVTVERNLRCWKRSDGCAAERGDMRNRSLENSGVF
jgi:hypothetical protein